MHGLQDPMEALKNSLEETRNLEEDKKDLSQANYENFAASSQEGLDKTCDRSLPSAWNNIALIMRKKSDLDTLSIDDLYNNLKVYESEIKGQTSSRLNSQNVAFVSSNNSNNTNETVNTTHSLNNEDLEQIDADDLEEMDLKWQVAMLTMRVKRFKKKIGRKLDLNDKKIVGFDRTKVECYNCHRRGHLSRECRALRNQGNRKRNDPRRNAPMDTSTTNALVVQDGIGSSTSSSLDSEVHTCSKDCLKSYEALQKQYDEQREALNKSIIEIIGYQMGLESLEARIVVHENNEAIYEKNIAFLKYDVQVKDISIKDLKNQLEQALKEKDDLKLKLENFEESSKNLTKLINSQISDKDKIGLGYDSQMNESELNNIHMNESKVVHSMFNSRESDVDDSPVNDRFKTGEGFHAIPPPFTRNYMPPRPDLSFAGIDEYVLRLQPSAPIIEEWDTDNDNDSVFRPKPDQTKLKFTKINFVKSGENVKSVNKENTHRQRVNHQNKLTHPHPKRNFVPTAVATKSGQVPVNAAKQSSPRATSSISTVRPVNTAAPKSKVNDALPITYSYFKTHSPLVLLREMGKILLSPQHAGFGDKQKMLLTIPPKTVDHTCLKDLTMLIYKADSSHGCSRHMTGNKSFLTDYQEINGGFISFGGSSKGGKITGKGKIRTGKLDFEDVYFVKELKFNLFSVSQMCDKKNSVLFHLELNVFVSISYFKLLDETSNFSWVFFLATKDETPEILKNFITGIENQIDHKVKTIRCDNGIEFKNRIMNEFCEIKGIKREFSIARTPQQNGVAERKNRTLIEVARTMLADSKLPTTFWAEAVNTACYFQNRMLVIKPHNKIPYELFLGRKPALSFMRPFGCPVTILNTLDHLDDAQEIPDEFYGGAHFILRIASTIERGWNLHQLRQDEEADNVDVHLYRSMIGSLMYLIASKPDITFAVCACARDSPFDLKAFTDSDYAGASLDRKSTTEGCQFLHKRLISWQCKKQTIVANSNTEAENVAFFCEDKNHNGLLCESIS
ncbi:ribonuclease H-like domain-containing protein [Tanacetum coccineum]